MCPVITGSFGTEAIWEALTGHAQYSVCCFTQISPI